MKLSVIIKRFLKDDIFLPTDFYWINMNTVKKNVPNILQRITLLGLFYCLATLFCVCYYITIPFRLISEWCESWCY